MINYIVAPFGSQEYLNVNYGVKDQDYKFDDNGNPQRTQQGLANMISWQGVMGVPAPVLFDPQQQGLRADDEPVAAGARARAACRIRRSACIRRRTRSRAS